MLNLKKICLFFKISMVSLLLIASLANAEDRQSVNAITVSLREGPGSQYKIVKSLPSDQSFEVLETVNDFIRIRTKDGTEGWLQDRTADAQAPEVIIDKNPNEKVDVPGSKQSDKLSLTSGRVTAQHPDASIDSLPRKEFSEQPSAKELMEIKKLQTELAEMTKQFEQLKADSEDAQQFTTENDKLKAELSAVQISMAQLQQTNISLAKNQNIFWFLAGGAVFFLGWLIGRSTIRRQRHSSLTL